MHELSVAQSIIDTVLLEVAEKELPAVSAIGVRIGALSGIFADALIFGFDAMKQDGPLESAKLEVEDVPVRGACLSCGKDFEISEFIFSCPDCQSVDIEVTAGNELSIVYLEVYDE